MDNKENKLPTETNTQAEALKNKNNNMPIIISAVVVGFLFIVAVVLILIFGQKTERIKSYNLGSFRYDKIDSEKFDKQIIKSKNELDDFYKSFQANYTLNNYYGVVEAENDLALTAHQRKIPVGTFADDDYESESESALTYCDWLKEYGDEETWNSECLDEAPETQSREDACWSEFYRGDVPDYCEDFLEDPRIERPSELNENYFKDHDLLVLALEGKSCQKQLDGVKSVEKNGKNITITLDYLLFTDRICSASLTSYNFIFVELDKDFISTSDMIYVN